MRQSAPPPTRKDPLVRRHRRRAGACLAVLTAAACGTVAAEGGTFMIVHDPADTAAVRAVVTDGAASDPELALVASWRADDESFSVVDAASDSTLASRLDEHGVRVQRLRTVLDLNSPERGGGEAAGSSPREGHSTFIIQRRIPGVGYFPPDRKASIAAGSNAAIDDIGDSIEWVRSYLTDEGTFCVYRATDEATIRRHGIAIGPEILDLDVVDEIDITAR